jgi:hypothetical protein
MELLALLALHKLPLVGDCVDVTVLHVLAEKTGREVQPQGLGGAEEDIGDEELDGPRTDPDPRRRVVRTILEKLDRRGKWFPACSERRAVARGFSGPDVGLALNAAVVLIRAGWLNAETKHVTESAVGLNGAHRDDIEAMIRTGACTDPTVEAWLYP